MPQVEIVIKGSIDEDWSEYFADLSIEHAVVNETVLRGWLVDKSALYGVLSRLSSLGLTLISVHSQADAWGTNPASIEGESHDFQKP